MIYWIILIILIAAGIYDLYLYFKGRDTLTQLAHNYIEHFGIPIWPRLIVTIGCLASSWWIGGITLFVPVLAGWILCHLIGWDF